jgi:elongation factor 3
MAPAATEAAAHTAANIKSENAKSLKVLEGLLSKLTISKAQDEINAASLDLATFINGDIEEADAPTKYVPALFRITDRRSHSS